MTTNEKRLEAITEESIWPNLGLGKALSVVGGGLLTGAAAYYDFRNGEGVNLAKASVAMLLGTAVIYATGKGIYEMFRRD